MAVHETARSGLLSRSIASVDSVLRNEKWAIAVYDDGSTGNEMDVVHSLSTAREIAYEKGPKSRSVAASKNKAVDVAIPLSARYGQVLFMDDDDEMLPGRLELSREAARRSQPLAFGDLETVWPSNPSKPRLYDGGVRIKDRCLSPCCSVLNSRLLKPGFWIDGPWHEDSVTFTEMWRRGVFPCYHKTSPVHRYWKRCDSASFKKSGTLKMQAEKRLRETKPNPFDSVEFTGDAGELAMKSFALWHPHVRLYDGSQSTRLVVSRNLAFMEQLEFDIGTGWTSDGMSLEKTGPVTELGIVADSRDDLVVNGGLWNDGFPVYAVDNIDADLVNRIERSLCPAVDQRHGVLRRLLATIQF